MSSVRLIAIDLDGTLLNPEGRVGEEDAAAVRRAVQTGLHVVLATARWHAAARRTALALGIDGPIISHNGALVRWSDGNRELLHHTLDLGLSREIALALDAMPGDAYVTVGDITYLKTARWRAGLQLATDMAFTDSISACIEAAPTSFLLFGRESVQTLVERFGHLHGQELNLAEGFSASFPNYLNVVHARADKGAALLAVCEALGVAPEQTLAIGDAAPDVPMFRVAGVAVAMGNAAPEVQAAATVVAPPNDRSGVAWSLQKLVF